MKGGKIVSDFDEFFKEAQIINDQCCEFEVSHNAMEKYTKYPCYDKWCLIENENSIFSYYRNYEANIPDYKGAYLLKSEDNKLVLTADILTSIKKPCNIIREKMPFFNNIMLGVPGTGREISSFMVNVNVDQLDVNKKVVRYLKAFAIVYYWCGNMMPVICNKRGTGDEGVNKIRILSSAFAMEKNDTKQCCNYYANFINNESLINGRNVKTTELLTGWIVSEWKDKQKKGLDEFINSYFLNDYFDSNSKLKEIPLFDYKDFGDDKAIKWLEINTKLIIQRSYRLVNKNVKDWNDRRRESDNMTHKEFVVELFREIFVNKSGIEENKNGLLELF